MGTQALYHAALVVHIIGLAMMAGITLADFIMYRQFWKTYSINKPVALNMRAAFAKLPMFFGIGFILLVLSGVSMMGITHGVFGEQLWFRIKFAMIILIVINGLGFGRRQGVKLRKILAEGNADDSFAAGIMKIKNNLALFHITQIVLFLIIFSLSVFKFN